MMTDEDQFKNLIRDHEADELKVLVEALYEIAADSTDVETVRTAMSALTCTESGLTYLKKRPMVR